MGSGTRPARAFGQTRPELASLAKRCARGRVSVIIPCFNAGAFVGDAIAGALAQRWPDLEVIVVDDGSTDDSRKVAEGYAEQVLTIRSDRGGAPKARNLGLQAATGEFIQFLDADDVLLADSIGDRAIALGEHSSAIHAVFGDREFVEHLSGRVCGRTSHADWPEPDPLAHLIRNNIHTESPLHRRNRLYEIGGFDETLPCSQELDLHIRLLLAGARMVYLPKVVARARAHRGSDRIENAPWWREDPDRHLRIVEHHRRLITGAGDQLLSRDVQRALSFKLWSRGMIAGRNGAFKVSRRYFREARRYSSPLQPEGSFGLRLCHRLLGPTATAWALYHKQRTASRLHRG